MSGWPRCADLALGVEALKEAGVPPKLLIIDDGWQLTRADGQGPLGGAHAPPASPDASDEAPRSAAGWLAPPWSAPWSVQ